MNREWIISALAIALIGAATAAFVWNGIGRDPMTEATAMDGGDHDDEPEEGPNGGRLLRSGSFALEVTVYETGMPSEFRLYAYVDDEPVDPSEVDAEIALTRLGGDSERFEFAAEGGYLRSLDRVREPHSFDVEVEARHAGSEHRWSYESHEGRTTIPPRVAEAQGIEVETAGPATIVEAIELTGTIQADPGRVSQVRARFPGVVTDVRKTVGDLVTAGESLGTVQTNESLRSVSIDAPIGGLIVDRNVQNGQVTGSEPLFVISDLSEVWIYLDVFGADLAAAEVGQAARIETLNGVVLEDEIDWISPLVAHGSQSVRARVTVPNPENRLRPGEFVRASVRIAEYRAPLAVRLSALQTFRDFDVVFARVGDVYEVRMLELGRRDSEWVEVLDGLEPGEVYVTGNSYLIKADIEKSGATHDH